MVVLADISPQTSKRKNRVEQFNKLMDQYQDLAKGTIALFEGQKDGPIQKAVYEALTNLEIASLWIGNAHGFLMQRAALAEQAVDAAIKGGAGAPELKIVR